MLLIIKDKYISSFISHIRLIEKQYWERGERMRKMILVSHGSLAEGMRSAADMILAGSVRMDAFGLDTWGTPQAILEEVRKILAESPANEYIILCDIKGGSAYNAMVELALEPNVQIVSGMNLNLVLDLALMPEKQKFEDMIGEFVDEAQRGIEFLDVSVMSKMTEKEEEDELW